MTQLMNENPINEKRIKEAIQLLNLAKIDGETMEYILGQVGLNKQMLKQLVLKATETELTPLIEERNELNKPLDPKEKYLRELEAKVLRRLGDSLSCGFETCSSAPSFGWSRDEYIYMPTVADRLRAKGYTIKSSVNHGVTDWVIGR